MMRLLMAFMPSCRDLSEVLAGDGLESCLGIAAC